MLGSGGRLFDDAGEYAALRLMNSVTTTGVVIATYQASTATGNAAANRCGIPSEIDSGRSTR
jgi:hypothetical protein